LLKADVRREMRRWAMGAMERQHAGGEADYDNGRSWKR